MKNIVLTLALILTGVLGITAQDASQRYPQRQEDCRYAQDHYGRIYEQCRILPYMSYGQWHRYYKTDGRDKWKRHGHVFLRFGF